MTTQQDMPPLTDKQRAEIDAMTLPDITEVERLTLRPGDVLVVHLNAASVPADQAGVIKERLRAVLGIDDLRILLVARDMRVEVLEAPR